MLGKWFPYGPAIRLAKVKDIHVKDGITGILKVPSLTGDNQNIRPMTIKYPPAVGHQADGLDNKVRNKCGAPCFRLEESQALAVKTADSLVLS